MWKPNLKGAAFKSQAVKTFGIACLCCYACLFTTVIELVSFHVSRLCELSFLLFKLRKAQEKRDREAALQLWLQGL